MKKAIKAQEERDVKGSGPQEPSSTPLPNYLLDRSNATNAKALSSAIKNKRAEKAAKFSVPLPKVKGISEEQMFKVVKTGKKTAKKSWKRMITQPTFVGQDFTRRPVKYERFIRPMGLRYKKANVSALVQDIEIWGLRTLGYSSRTGCHGPVTDNLGEEESTVAHVFTTWCALKGPKTLTAMNICKCADQGQGTIIEVNVSELGLVTTGGKVVWGKYAQVRCSRCN